MLTQKHDDKEIFIITNHFDSLSDQEKIRGIKLCMGRLLNLLAQLEMHQHKEHLI